METKDGKMGFDFEGTFTVVEPMRYIAFRLGDDRAVSVTFSVTDEGTVIVEETFEVENENSAQRQRDGWQAILENFRALVEASRA